VSAKSSKDNGSVQTVVRSPRAKKSASATSKSSGAENTIGGRTWVFGDNVDTDVIIPARYLLTSDPVELAKHCMEDLDPGFAQTVRPGDAIVAGENFGCGSSREHAPLAIKGAGISVVIASSFANIFYRNAINIGLPILECPEAVQAVRQGDEVRANLMTGRIDVVSDGKTRTYQAQSYPDSILRIIQAGGLIAATRDKLRAEGKLASTTV
jgi:3-isopropylmalate/(R)-2-methylmalate dehydratase small subunit